MRVMQGDTSILIGGAHKESVGKLAREFLRRYQAPLALPQDVQGDGRHKAFLEEALVRGGVVEGEKLLMRLVKLVGRPSQGQLVIIQTPLNVEMGFVRSVG